MIYDVFTQRLAGLNAQLGASLFVGMIPAPIKVAIMLREPLSGTPIDPHMPGHYRAQLQVITRHENTMQGLRLAKEAQKLLTTQHRVHFDATDEHGAGHLDLCFPRTKPVMYPRLDSNLWEWSQIFDVVWGVAE